MEERKGKREMRGRKRRRVLEERKRRRVMEGRKGKSGIIKGGKEIREEEKKERKSEDFDEKLRGRKDEQKKNQ